MGMRFGLIRQRGCDLFKVDFAQVEHALRVGPKSGTLKRRFHRCGDWVESRERRFTTGVGSTFRTRTEVRHDGEPIRS